MKKIKKLALTLGVTTLVASAGIGVYAAEISSPAEILSRLTGTSVESLYESKGSMKFGELAEKEGVSEEFRQEMLANKKAILDQRVAEGRITQEQADEIYKNMVENQGSCDGTGIHRGERNLGLGMGAGMGRGNGNGEKIGGGNGFGNGHMMQRNQKINNN